MKVYASVTKNDLDDFINPPFKIYQSDPMWAPPLKSELHNQFKPEKNPFLDHCNYRLFLLKEKGKVIGRIAAFIDTLANDLKPILHEKAVTFAEDSDGKLIGFGIALPDVNQILKRINGKLFPFRWLKLLVGLPKLIHKRMFALGVISEYHGYAVDSLIYRALYESCFSPDLRMEINYVLEDNGPMNIAIVKLGTKPLRRYRIYEIPVS